MSLKRLIHGSLVAATLCVASCGSSAAPPVVPSGGPGGGSERIADRSNARRAEPPRRALGVARGRARALPYRARLDRGAASGAGYSGARQRGCARGVSAGGRSRRGRPSGRGGAGARDARGRLSQPPDYGPAHHRGRARFRLRLPRGSRVSVWARCSAADESHAGAHAGSRRGARLRTSCDGSAGALGSTLRRPSRRGRLLPCRVRPWCSRIASASCPRTGLPEPVAGARLGRRRVARSRALFVSDWMKCLVSMNHVV